LYVERYLTTDEVIEQLTPWLPKATLNYWRHIGKGPRSARIGRRVVYRESDVREFLAGYFNEDAPGQRAG
jgi:predicted DNA-binding transcriptional regulator AlpA